MQASHTPTAGAGLPDIAFAGSVRGICFGWAGMPSSLCRFTGRSSSVTGSLAAAAPVSCTCCSCCSATFLTLSLKLPFGDRDLLGGGGGVMGVCCEGAGTGGGTGGKGTSFGQLLGITKGRVAPMGWLDLDTISFRSLSALASSS